MRLFLSVWLITLLSLANPSPGDAASTFQQQTTITAEAYWDLVQSTRQAITQLEAKPAGEIRQRLDSLAAHWEQVNAVELSDHGVVQVDSSYLVSQLHADPPDLQRLANILDALLNAHNEYPQNIFKPADVDPLKEILARPEFSWDQGQTLELPKWLANLFDSISKFFDRIIFSVANLIFQWRYLLMVAAAVVLLISLFYIARNLSRSLVREAQLAEEGSEEETILTSKGAIQRAQTLSTQGDYRNAIRYLYLSSLLMLDEQGLLRYDRSRTNREYLRSISSHPELANPLRDVIDVFDRVWYGFEPVDQQTYESYQEHVNELREKKE